MLAEGKGGEKAQVKCVIKWVKCCPGINVCWQGFCCMLKSPKSLLSLACSRCSVEGGGSQEEKRMTGTRSAFILCTKTLSLLSFSSHLSNMSRPLLPSFSSTQIPTEWDKERKRQTEKGRWEVMGCKCFVSWPLGAKRENVACVCVSLFFCTLWSYECILVFVCFLVKCTIVQRSGDCVYLSFFSNTWGKERDWTDIWGIRERRGCW